MQLETCFEGIVNFSAAVGYLVISLGTQFTRIFGIVMSAYSIATSCYYLRYAKVPDICKYEVKNLPSEVLKKLKGIKKYRNSPDFIQYALEDLKEKFKNVGLLCHLENKEAHDFEFEASAYKKIEEEMRDRANNVDENDILNVEKEIEETDFKRFTPRKNADKRKAGEWTAPNEAN